MITIKIEQFFSNLNVCTYIGIFNFWEIWKTQCPRLNNVNRKNNNIIMYCK